MSSKRAIAVRRSRQLNARRRCVNATALPRPRFRRSRCARADAVLGACLHRQCHVVDACRFRRRSLLDCRARASVTLVRRAPVERQPRCRRRARDRARRCAPSSPSRLSSRRRLAFEPTDVDAAVARSRLAASRSIREVLGWFVTPTTSSLLRRVAPSLARASSRVAPLAMTFASIES